MRLENESDIAFRRGFIVDTHIVQIDRAFFGFVQSSDTAERRCFSCARLSEKHKEFFISDIKGDVVKSDEIAEPLCNVFEFYCCHKGFYDSVL